MDKNEAKRIARQKLIAKHPEMATTFAMQDLAEEIKNQTNKPEPKKEPLKIEGVSMLKGEKGEKGDKGEIGFTGPQGEKGEKGLDSQIPGPKGDRGESGINGIDGKDGLPGNNGKDGSPDTPEEIVAKINTLEEAINISAIKGIPTAKDFITAMKKLPVNERLDISDIRNWNQPAKGKLDQRWHGGGLTQVYHDTTLTGLGTASSPLHANVAASGLTVGTTIITSGTNGLFLYDNNGVLGEVAGLTKALADTYYYPLSTNPAGYLTAGSLPAQLWTEASGTLYPTTTTDRVLIGGATDDTTSALQVNGVAKISQISTNYGSSTPPYLELYADDGQGDISDNFICSGFDANDSPVIFFTMTEPTTMFPADTQIYIDANNGWLNMPTGLASGIGTGGSGANPWIAYAPADGNWFDDALTGDVCYRNDPAYRLLFGLNNGSGNSEMLIDSTKVNISKKLNLTGLPSGTLISPPGGLNIGDVWKDVTTSSQYPILRIRKT